MRLLVIGDVHESLAALTAVLYASTSEALDLIVVTGDFADVPSVRLANPSLRAEEQAKSWYKASLNSLLSLLSHRGLPIIYVPGNHDDPGASVPAHPHVYNVDLWESTVGLREGVKPYRHDSGLTIIGIGGSTHTPFHGPYEWSDADPSLSQKLSARIKQMTEPDWAERGIILAHCPPKWCCSIDIGGQHRQHLGSEQIRDILVRHRPLMMITGHVHEASGVDIVEETLVLNAGSLHDILPVSLSRPTGSGKPIIADVAIYHIITLNLDRRAAKISTRGLVLDPVRHLRAHEFHFSQLMLREWVGDEWREVETTGTECII